MILRVNRFRRSMLAMAAGLLWVAIVATGCTHITQGMREAIDADQSGQAIVMGEAWIAGASSETTSDERLAVILLIAEARLREAAKADTDDAYREFQLRYRNDGWAKQLRDRAYEAEAAATLRDAVMPRPTPEILLKFAGFYPTTAAAGQARVLAAALALDEVAANPSVEVLRDYRAQYASFPGTERFVAEAGVLEFKLALRDALGSRRVANLRAFRERYRPVDGSEADLATRKLELELAYDEAQQAPTETKWVQFIATYRGWPGAAQKVAAAEEAIVELNFAAAVRAGIEALERFGGAHPSEPWPTRVMTAINTILLVPVGGYLSGHPLNHDDVLELWSSFAHRPGLPEAFAAKREAFAAAASEREDSGGLLLLYLLASPCPLDATEAVDLEAALWNEAMEADTVAAWESYLTLAPPQPRRGEAEARFIALRDIARAGKRGMSAQVTHTVVRRESVDLYVNVTDCHHERVSGLSQEAFRLYEGSVARPISAFLGVNDDRPLDIMFAIDLSGSMDTEQDAVRSSVQQFADQFSFRMRNLSLGLITFNEELVSKQRPQPNEATFQRWLSGMTRTSGGNGEDSVGALVESSNLFGGRAERVVIVMTDEALQANRTGRALLKHKPAADPCLTLQQASSCFQKATSAGGMSRCAAQVDRSDPGHKMERAVQQCMARAGVRQCQSAVANELAQAAQQCAVPTPAWSPVVDEISQELNKRGTRAFFIISEGPETFHRLGAELGGKAYEVPDDTTSEAPYTAALLDIADRLSSQYVITFKRSSPDPVDLSKLNVVVHPESLLRTVATLAADRTRALHVGGDLSCPAATAIAGNATRYRTTQCGAQWEAMEELTGAGANIDSVVLTDSAEFHLSSDQLLTIRGWPSDTVMATVADHNITAIYADGAGGIWAEGSFEGAKAFASIDSNGVVGTLLPLDAGAAAPMLVLNLPKGPGGRLCYTADGLSRRCRGPKETAWVTEPVQGLATGAGVARTRFAGMGSGRPLQLLTTEEGALLRSIDGGQSWATTLRLPGAGHPMVVLSDDGIVCASTMSQMSCSEDDGMSWAEVGGLAGASATHPAIYRGKLFALAGRQFLRADRVEAREVPSTKAFFDTADATPNNRIMPFLSEIAERAKRDPALMIRVEGHADKRGDADKNLTLSEDRAEGVASLLQRLGVPDAQIETVALGETKPIRDSRGNIQDERSRRVELMLLRSAPTQTWFTSQCDDE